MRAVLLAVVISALLFLTHAQPDADAQEELAADVDANSPAPCSSSDCPGEPKSAPEVEQPLSQQDQLLAESDCEFTREPERRPACRTVQDVPPVSGSSDELQPTQAADAYAEQAEGSHPAAVAEETDAIVGGQVQDGQAPVMQPPLPVPEEPEQPPPQPQQGEVPQEPAAVQQQPAPETPQREPEEELLELELRNFALIKDGAKVMQANKEAKKLNALLDSDSDTYVKNDCKADKWYVIELSQVAKINRVELWQHELYSSRLKNFEVRGRQSHPRVDGVELSKGLNSTQWKLLGNLTAENKKGSQQFALEHPTWVRFLLLQILSHYGSEPMCAINGFAAYGKSAAEEFEEHLGSEETLHYLQTSLDVATPDLKVQAHEPAAPQTVAGTAPAVVPGTAAAAGGGAEEPKQGSASTEQDAAVQQQPAPTQPVASAAAAATSTETATAPGKAATAAAPETQPSCSGETCSCTTETGTPACAAAPPQGSQQQEQPGESSADAAAVPASTPAAPTAAAAITSEHVASVPATAQMDTGKGVDVSESGSGASAPEAKPPAGSDRLEPSPAQSTESALPTSPGALVAPVLKDGTGAKDTDFLPTATSADISAASLPEQEAQAAPGSQPVAQQGQALQQQQQQQKPQQQSAPGDGIEDIPSVLSWSPKSKGSASVYDILLQEIKSAKLNQKLATKTIAELQRNVTAQDAELAAEIASVTAELSKVQKEVNSAEEAILLRAEVLVGARLQQLSEAVAELRAASEASTRRELAVLCLLSILGAAMVLSLPAGRLGPAWVRWLVVLLAIGNGMAGLLLQYKGGLDGWAPAALLQALK